jgi:glycosyltransferase involved in cell wall biosynthesis
MKYLLEALRLLRTDSVELTICGRVLDDLALFRPFASQVKIRPSVSAADLVRAYQSADLFLFPSIGEGFGHVLLEALASGLPILSTTHTAAPDLIQDSAQGFIVEPRRPDLLAERIEWALTHRNELAEMRLAARACAETFTWRRFRRDAAQAVRSSLAETSRSHNGRERSHV